mgnify:CR=1 FL=1
MFFSPKNNTRTFFYTSIAIPEPKVTDLQKKIKMHPLSAIWCFYICFFTHFVRFMLIYAFFFERENEAFVHRCAQGPSLSNLHTMSKISKVSQTFTQKIIPEFVIPPRWWHFWHLAKWINLIFGILIRFWCFWNDFYKYRKTFLQINLYLK